MGMICRQCLARDSALCSAMAGDEIDELFSIARRVKVDGGSYLLHEEDSSRFVYNLSSGVCTLERLASDGRRQIMAFVYPGDFIGINAGPAYSVSVRALNPVTACCWKMKDVTALYRSHPVLEQRLHEIASRVLAATMDQLFVLGRKNAVEKIACFLLYIDARQQKFDDHGDCFILPMTRLDIADYLGVTVETVSRAFSRLKKKGLIELSQAWSVTLKDRTALHKMVEHTVF